MSAEVSAVTLLLQPEHDARVPAWLGRAAQANFLHTLETVHPDFSKAIHDAQGAKPFTSSTLIGAQLQGDMVQLRSSDRLRLRYTTLHPQLTAVFHTRMLPVWQANGINLHNQPLRVVEMDTGKQSTWNQESTYVQLLDQASAQRTITLTFSSPTSFKRTSGGFSPLPQPELVFSSLLDRWNAFAPFRLPEELYDTVHEDIVIERANIQTETLVFAHGQKGTVTGFTGKVTFHLTCSEEKRRFLQALGAFARYSGVGVKTSVGMGQVQQTFGSN